MSKQRNRKSQSTNEQIDVAKKEEDIVEVVQKKKVEEPKAKEAEAAPVKEEKSKKVVEDKPKKEESGLRDSPAVGVHIYRMEDGRIGIKSAGLPGRIAGSNEALPETLRQLALDIVKRNLV